MKSPFRFLSTLTVILFIALSILAANFSTTLGASTLNFPRLGFDTNTFTGVAFVNPNAADAEVTIKAYGTDGNLIQGVAGFKNTVQLTIPALRQVALTTTEIFGAALPADQFGWMQATSTSDGITGFFLFLDGSITLFDGADLPESARKLVVPRIREGEGYSTEINIINPGTQASDLDLQLFVGGQGAPKAATSPITVPAKGMVRLNLKQNFGLETVPDGTFLLITGSAPIGGFEMVYSQGQDLVGLNARPTSEGLDILYFPQMAVLGPWVTNLGLVNLSDTPIIATVSAREASGKLYEGGALQGSNPAVISLPAGEAVYRDVAELFGFSGDNTVDGWLKVESSGPAMTGFVTYGIPAFGSAAAVASQPEAMNRAIFSHVATSLGYFTGVALLNPGQIANPYRVMAFNKETGSSLGVFDGVLQPGERISKLITELIPGDAADGQSGGFIWVKTEQPAYMTSLFGTAPTPDPGAQHLVLANIPPQPAPAGYRPDAALPSIKITPPLAVVQPGKTTQFTAVDGQGNTQSGVEWEVNGIESGDAQVGKISETGVYTAPGSDPSTLALPVTISGKAGNAKSGASVDVLKKEVLFQGTGVVQSLTYLRSLKRLYSAELQSGTASSGISPQAGPSTDIYSTTSAGDRTRVRGYSGKNIVKMLEFTASDGNEYLLFCDQVNGEILRFNPRQPTSTLVSVWGGFTQPNSMAFDPVTRNLLVADATGIWSVERTNLESGLATSGASLASVSDGPEVATLISGINNARGVSVDACTGNIYVTDGAGQLLEYDRLTGNSRTILDLGSAGTILGLYRKEIPCPASFQVLVADQESNRIVLAGPFANFDVNWLSDAGVQEISYLPIDNDFTGNSGILIGEVSGATTQAALVPVPDLYVNQQKNVSLPQYGSDFADPVGDTFGSVTNPVDLTLVTTGQGEVASDINIAIRFAQPVDPSALTGYIELDVDRNPETGATSFIDLTSPYTANLGVEYRIDLSTYTPFGGAEGEVQIKDAITGQVVGSVLMFHQPDLTSEIYMYATLSDLNVSLPIHLGVIVGPQGGLTDVAPNGGYLVPIPFNY